MALMVDDLSENIPSNPWDIHVDLLERLDGADTQTARDWVILEWLTQGDTRAFSYFVFHGHQPGKEVIGTIALMMNRIEGRPSVVPYALVSKSLGTKGRRPNPETKVRDKIICMNVERKISEGSTYNAAIDEVTDLLGTEQRDTVEKAYKKFKR